MFIVIIAVAAIAAWVVLTFNKLVALKNQAPNAFATGTDPERSPCSTIGRAVRIITAGRAPAGPTTMTKAAPFYSSFGSPS